jgi:uncharacterized membrane protein YphA (DoxX/SURF4 family)
MTISNNERDIESFSTSRIDAGLLILRVGIGLSFIFLFGLKQSEASKIFIDLPGRSWPLVLLSIAAFAVVCGFFSRLAATLSASMWALAMYSALRVGVEWFILPIRSAEFVVLFTALAATGPGKYSLDYAIQLLLNRKGYGP